jgi:hypothetical protein
VLITAPQAANITNVKRPTWFNVLVFIEYPFVDREKFRTQLASRECPTYLEVGMAASKHSLEIAGMG